MKANHNWSADGNDVHGAVSNKTKILKWKQITTVTDPDDDKIMLFPIRQRY